jgi:hypothetical protein
MFHFNPEIAQRLLPLIPVPNSGRRSSAKKLDHIMTLYAADAIFFTIDGARFAEAPVIRDFFQKTLASNDPNIHMHRVASERLGTPPISKATTCSFFVAKTGSG